MGLISIEWHTLHSRYISADSTIVDLGANYGRFATKVVRRFGCRCFAVEAAPEVCGAIESSDRIKKFNLAITSKLGPTQFAVRESLASALKGVGTEEAANTVTVEGVTLEHFMKSVGLIKIDVLKCDIEGAEIEMLDSSPDYVLASIGQISIEFHDFCGITPESEVTRVLRRLRSLGFYPIRMSRIGHQDTLLINRKLCPISLTELLYLRFVVRNWAGFSRVAGRVYDRLISSDRGSRPKLSMS